MVTASEQHASLSRLDLVQFCRHSNSHLKAVVVTQHARATRDLTLTEHGKQRRYSKEDHGSWTIPLVMGLLHLL